ncbi:DNA adenine methylase, partial [bacterium]|nr:DNA adenine methylase [bacterium]
MRYAGGKSLAVGYIVELLPDNVRKVVSPFIGGASVEIALANELNIEVIGYDIFDILVNYWQVQIEKPEELFTKLSELKPDREEYYRIKSILKSYWDGNIELDRLTLAAYYFFNHNLSYGPGFLGWPSSVYLNEKRYLNMILKV